MPYCAYVRKSRVDIEAEQRGEGETLKRHETALKDLALRMNIKLDAVYKEIVSGETITSRPIMQQLLAEVEQGKWDGVFVMEVERLARGDTIDQGLVAQTFKLSNTKIITPMKTYNPNDEFDEEYFEFGLFMSRREYKTINRRLQRGREASAREGKFVGSIAPYGYEKIKLPNDKGYTLKIVPEDADVVRLMFKFYTEGLPNKDGVVEPIGLQKIARVLNERHITPHRKDYWMKDTIKDIITNPVYAGKIRWGYSRAVKLSVNGETVQKRQENKSEYVIVDGIHEAIVSEEIFNKAQQILARQPAAPVGYKNEIKSSLAGLVICQICGRKMVYRRSYAENKSDYIVCHARHCANVSSPYHLVEKQVLVSLGSLAKKFELEQQMSEPTEKANLKELEDTITRINSDIKTYNKQLSNAQDLLEKDVYSIEDYITRSALLKEKIAFSKEDLAKAQTEFEKTKNLKEQRARLIPKIKHVLATYNKLDTPAEKNLMLKEVIDQVFYIKTVHGSYKGNSADDFEITVYPRLQ